MVSGKPFLTRAGIVTVAVLIGMLALVGGVSGATTIYVNESNSGIENGLLPETGWNTIQKGINNASTGDTINVSAGTYNENVDVNVSVNLVGAGATVTIVNASNPSDDVFYVTANSVNISGFTVTGATGEPFSGIYLNGANNSNISNNLITNNFKGIWLEGSMNSIIVGNNASMNNIASISDGIYLSSSSNNTILNNIVSSNRDEGIQLYYSHNNVVAGNTVSDNGNTSANRGIDIFSSNYNNVTNNTVTDNYYGIRLNSSDNTLLYHNNLINNSQNGYDNSGTNSWDDGYPSGGNYWSDYTGTDSGSDGIGDTPYVINSSTGSQDNYPVIIQDGWPYITPDTTPPLISFIFPTPPNNSIPSTDTITINVSHTEANPSILILNWNGTNESYSYSGSYTNITRNLTNVSANYTYYVWINDTAGNSNQTETRVVQINYTDMSSPTIAITSPQNTTYYNTSVDLNYSVSETASWEGYSLDGAANVTLTENITLNGLSYALHSVTVYANDTTGNMGSSTVWFTVSLPPVHNLGSGLNYTTIQEAIDAAETLDNHTILVDAGTYAENVNVNKSLNIIGAGATVTIVNASNANDHVFNITANNVNITGLTVTGATGDDFSGIFLRGANNSNISNNNISNNFVGILLDQANNNTISNNNVSRNIGCGGIGSWRIVGGCWGDRASSGNIISYNTVSNNANIGEDEQDDRTQGIYFAVGSRNIIRGNNVSYNGNGRWDDGIWMDFESDSIVENNFVDSTFGRFGIHSIGVDNVTYRNNTVLSTHGIPSACGLSLNFASNSLIINNTAMLNEWCGIIQVESENVTIANNFAGGQKTFGHGIVNWQSRNATVVNNTAINNYKGIILQETNSSRVSNNNASYNYKGIVLFNSNHNNTIEDNIADSNKYFGIYIAEQNRNNTIQRNNATNSYFGIYLVSSFNNTIKENNVSSNYYYGILAYNATDNVVISNTKNLTEHGAVSAVSLFVNHLYASTLNGTNYTYHFTAENMGNLWDTINITYSNPDGVEFVGIQACSPGACEDKSNVTIAPGSPDNAAYPDSIRVTVRDLDVGAYTLVVKATSLNNNTVSDSITVRIIVHGPDHPDSAIINSTTTDSSIFRSLINNSNISGSNISDSLVYSSNVTNTTLKEVVLRNAHVENGVISTGNITLGNITYEIVSPSSITDGAIVTGTDIEDSTLIGMTNRTLDVDAENSNISVSLLASSDYFLGSMSFQRSSVYPVGTSNQTNNVGGYADIEASENVEASTSRIYLQVYYNESELGNVSEENLMLQIFNTTTQRWEYTNKTFDDNFSNSTLTASRWTNVSGNWTVGSGEYVGNASDVGVTYTSVNTTSAIIETKMNFTSANGFIVFSDTDSGNAFYFAGALADENNWTVGRYNGTWNYLNKTNETINTSQDYNIEVFVEDGLVSLIVDGVEKIRHDFGSLPKGRVGLGVNNATTYFDDFVVYQPVGGVNSTENYVWANTTHFSVYGVMGSVYGVAGPVIIELKEETSLSSGPSGGGGPPSAEDKETEAVIATPTEADVVVQVDAAFSSIPENKTGTISIPETGDMPLTEMAIKVKSEVSNVEIAVKTLTSRPTEITTEIAGEVLRYLKIDHENIGSDDIETVTIKFKVEKTWIAKNDIDTVVLNRFSDDRWNALTTVKDSEDEQYGYYSAESPGLSVFGISGQVQTVATTTLAPTTTPPPTTLAPITPLPTVPQTTPIPTPAPSIPLAKVGVVLIVIVAIAAGAYVYFKKAKP